jgi:hypothetical protein
MPDILATRKVYFVDGAPPFEGDTILENGGVWCIEEDEAGVAKAWRWYPGQRIDCVYRGAKELMK